MIAMLWLAATSGQLPVQDKLDQIDRTFVCPESLPSDEARQDATKLFVEQVQAADPNATIKSLVEYRMSLLAKHGCVETLKNIHESNRRK
jgi:hypothetical protein